MPNRSGRPLLMKGWFVRAKTNGSTGKMHGLRIVNTPPRYETMNKIIVNAS
jgi:hypothetical protein